MGIVVCESTGDPDGPGKGVVRIIYQIRIDGPVHDVTLHKDSVAYTLQRVPKNPAVFFLQVTETNQQNSHWSRR